MTREQLEQYRSKKRAKAKLKEMESEHGKTD